MESLVIAVIKGMATYLSELRDRDRSAYERVIMSARAHRTELNELLLDAEGDLMDWEEETNVR